MPLVDFAVDVLRRLLRLCLPPLLAAVVGGVIAGLLAAQLGPPPPPEPPLFSATGPLHLPGPPAPSPLVDPLDPAAAVVVARAAWDETPSTLHRLRRRTRPPSSSTHIVVHHSDFNDAPGPAAIRDYHRGPAGFADIGYHVVVGKDGTVFEGRPLDPAAAVVVARAAWDETPSTLHRLRRRARPPSSSTHIVVHHSDFDDAPGPAAIRDYHRGPAGFADIGYHVVVGRDGTVFEGRPLDRVGAHAGVAVEQRRDVRLDPDEDSIGVVLDGNFEHQRPDPTQLAAAARVIRDLRARYGIPARQVIGHRQVRTHLVEARGLTLQGDGTVCPGEAAFELIPALRLFSEPLRSPPTPPSRPAGGLHQLVAATGG